MLEPQAAPAPPQEVSRRGRLGGFSRELLEAALVALVIATYTRTFVFQAFKIPSASMEDNLLVGDHILVNKFIFAPQPAWVSRSMLPARPLRRGDVVVFRFPKDPSRDFIKRCVGLPGDTVAMRDKTLLLNGQALEESDYINHKDARTFRSPVLDEAFRRRDNFGPIEVPPDHYFFLGDNRDDSHDSRFWGPVPRSHVKGRAVVVYWSLEPEPPPAAVTGARGDGGRAASFLDRLARLRDATRWKRIFRVVR